jgi:hypothetical protein
MQEFFEFFSIEQLIPLVPWSKIPLYKDYFNRQFNYTDFIHGCNVGLKTGDIIVIDVDYRNGGGRLWECLLTMADVSTGKVKTPGGEHYYFKNPNGLRSAKRDGVDVQSYGRYVLIPPSQTKDTYQWEIEPTVMQDFPTEWEGVFWRPETVSRSKGGMSEGEARELLRLCDPDMSEPEWRMVGVALYFAGVSFAVWDEWSRRGLKYDARVMLRYWESFAKIKKPVNVDYIYKLSHREGGRTKR